MIAAFIAVFEMRLKGTQEESVGNFTSSPIKAIHEA